MRGGSETLRRLFALASQLPGESPLMLALTDGASAWGASEHLAAVQVDMLAGANWQRGGGKGPRPKPIERPGIEPEGQKKFGSGRSREELRELLRVHAGREVS